MWVLTNATDPESGSGQAISSYKYITSQFEGLEISLDNIQSHISVNRLGQFSTSTDQLPCRGVRRRAWRSFTSPLFTSISGRIEPIAKVIIKLLRPFIWLLVTGVRA